MILLLRRIDACVYELRIIWSMLKAIRDLDAFSGRPLTAHLSSGIVRSL